MGVFEPEHDMCISIHALLAESDDCVAAAACRVTDFYPRSPCGERHCSHAGVITPPRFLSTLSLRRATYFQFSPCPLLYEFLSTLSLRRATAAATGRNRHISISIHALLAESDEIPYQREIDQKNFYPRSPCGERPGGQQEQNGVFGISIHALLAESDSSACCGVRRKYNFYPRSPCGERPYSQHVTWPSGYFYPRSPCGERPPERSVQYFPGSHFYPRSPCGERPDTLTDDVSTGGFLSTLSLRRATTLVSRQYQKSLFLSTLSLRRATWGVRKAVGSLMDFYPRSPCGERLHH